MSFFHVPITVPKNTSSDAPMTQELEIQHGIIHRIHISIPSGHAGLTGVRLLQGLHQVAPTSGSKWFSGDDMELDYPEYIESLEAPFSLTVEAYNVDDTYAHTFRVGVGVLPEWVLLPQTILKDMLQGISDILGALSKWTGMTA